MPVNFEKIAISEGDSIVDAFHFTEGVYCGIIFSYSRVELIPKGDHLVLSFNYKIHTKNIEYKEPEIKQVLGDILVGLIDDGLLNNSLVYTGGTDNNEIRNNNSSEYDSE